MAFSPFMTALLSACGPKQTSVIALQVSALRGKADIGSCTDMSAFDPKRSFDRSVQSALTILRAISDGICCD